jgi:hypothetical protein
VDLHPEIVTNEMREAQLGMSQGLKTKLDPVAQEADLDDVLSKKLAKIEKKGRISPKSNEKEGKRSSLTIELMKNSVKNRIVGQIKEMMQKLKLKHQKAAKGESFKTAFPLYY